MPKDLQVAAAYIRVSTDDQLDLSPDSQLEEIRNYAKSHSLIIPQEFIFMEHDGISGKKADKRIAFQTMIATARSKPKPFDVILVWKFSRFARNQDESTYYKSILRKKCGIDIISVSEPIMEGMYGRLIEMIIEWQDEFYSYNLGVEVRRSMKLKAEKGLYNSQPPFGYHFVKSGIPTVNEEQAAIVRLIFEKYINGEDKNAIVRYLNEKGLKTGRGKSWTNETVKYILENPFYIGKVRWNRRQSSGTSSLKDKSEWIIVDSHHKPIIDEETWERARKKDELIMQTRKKYQHPVSHTKHWLSGMVKCSVCGRSLSWKSGCAQNKCNTFQCLGYRSGIHSESQSISERKLTAAVLESLHNVLDADDIEYTVINTNLTNNNEFTIYTEELKRIRYKEERIKQAYINGIDTLEEYKSNKQLLSERKNDIEQKIRRLTTIQMSDAEIRGKFLDNVRNAIDVIESDADFSKKAEALRSIVKYITFYKDSKTLVFHYFIAV